MKLACFCAKKKKKKKSWALKCTIEWYPDPSQTAYVSQTAAYATFYYCFHSSISIHTHQVLVMGVSLALGLEAL